jgi:hypothetical protein
MVAQKKLPDTITNPLQKVDTSLKIKQDSNIYKIIKALPEVKGFNNRYNLKKLNKNLNIVINERPDKTFPYYWVQVGVSDQYQFQPIYNFYVKDDSQVFFYDTINDSIITLKKWRETRGF